MTKDGGALPNLQASVRWTSLLSDADALPTGWGGEVTAHAGPVGAVVTVASVNFELGRVTDENEQDPELWEGVHVEYFLTFDVPRLNRRFQPDEVDLRLVAGLMARFSIERPIAVTLLSEPRGWQSHRLLSARSGDPSDRAAVENPGLQALSERLLLSA